MHFLYCGECLWVLPAMVVELFFQKRYGVRVGRRRQTLDYDLVVLNVVNSKHTDATSPFKSRDQDLQPHNIHTYVSLDGQEIHVQPSESSPVLLDGPIKPACGPGPTRITLVIETVHLATPKIYLYLEKYGFWKVLQCLCFQHKCASKSCQPICYQPCPTRISCC